MVSVIKSLYLTRQILRLRWKEFLLVIIILMIACYKMVSFIDSASYCAYMTHLFQHAYPEGSLFIYQTKYSAPFDFSIMHDHDGKNCDDESHDHTAQGSGEFEYIPFDSPFLSAWNANDAKLRAIEALPGVTGVARLSNVPLHFEQAQDPSSVTACNQALLKNMPLEVGQGRWFDGYILDNGRLPVVVSTQMAEKYPLGSIIPVELKFISFFSKKPPEFIYEMEVIGVLPHNGYTYQFGGGEISNYISTLYMPADEETMLIAWQPAWDEYLLRALIDQDSNAVFFEAGSSQDQRQHAADLCTGDLWPVDYERMIYQGQQMIHDIWLDTLIPALIAVAIAACGFYSAALLRKNSMEELYTVYYSYGAQWKKCVLIDFILSTVTSIIAALSFIIVSMAWKQQLYYKVSYGLLNEGSFALAGLAAIALCLIPSLFFIIGLHKKSPMSILRRN